MKAKKVFCEECRNDVTYTVSRTQMEGAIKGKKYSYTGKEAHCDDCGSEVYVAELNDYNLKALYDAYRVENGIVSHDIVVAIPEKYAIGKRPLSLLLGWGEQTYSRYYDGDLPTKQYSQILQKIYDEPQYYAEILEENKSNLKTLASYEKSKKAVEAILGLEQSDESKINLAIEYLLNQCEDITPLALQKALYYIQGFYFAFYNTFIFSEDCEAWVHGPVYKEIYFRYRDYRFDAINGNNEEFDSSVFSSPEKGILDSIAKNICCYSGKVLEHFTHSEMPWLSTRGELKANERSGRIIEKELIGKYFSNVKDKYKMINPNDIKDYAQNMFNQI